MSSFNIGVIQSATFEQTQFSLWNNCGFVKTELYHLVWSLVVALAIYLFIYFLCWNLHITIISHVSVLSGYFDYYCSHSNSWAETEKHQHTNLHCDLHSPGGYGGLVAWHLQGKQDCVWVPENNRAPPPVSEDQNHSARTKDRNMWGLFSDTLPWDLCSG